MGTRVFKHVPATQWARVLNYWGDMATYPWYKQMRWHEGTAINPYPLLAGGAR